MVGGCLLQGDVGAAQREAVMKSKMTLWSSVFPKVVLWSFLKTCRQGNIDVDVSEWDKLERRGWWNNWLPHVTRSTC